MYIPYDTTAHVWILSSSVSKFLNHTQLDKWHDPLWISLSHKPPPTQDNTTDEYKRQTSMPPAAFEPAILAINRPLGSANCVHYFL
jgi:hypothetical protein